VGPKAGEATDYLWKLWKVDKCRIPVGDQTTICQTPGP
jgi:hypothetical protein